MGLLRKIVLILLVVIAFARYWYVREQIEAFNMDYYSGKDNGFFVLFESIVSFGTLFCLIAARKNFLLNGILGFVLSIFVAVIVYSMVGTGLMFPIISSCAIMLMFVASAQWRKRHQGDGSQQKSTNIVK